MRRISTSYFSYSIRLLCLFSSTINSQQLQRSQRELSSSTQIATTATTTLKVTTTTTPTLHATNSTWESAETLHTTSSSNSISNNTTKLDRDTAKFYRELAFSRFPIRSMPTISKSYETEDPIINYCANVSLKLDPIQKKLAENTIKNAPMHGMLGAPEVLQFGQNLIRLIHAKRALDIGTYTGASALAWALALPADGEVISMDISHENLEKYGKEFIDSKPEIAKKINFTLGPAINTLDALLDAGQNESWDFAFIDADKHNYPNYYEKCVQLLRPGGVVLIDNALWGGSVIFEEKDEATKAIDATNHMIANDTRVDNMLLNLGDGTHVVFKKYQ